MKVAVEGPLTGPQSATGIDMLHGAQLAAQQINANGGVLGKTIDIVPADDAATASQGVTVANQMVAEHVSAVIGPFNSSVGVAVLPIYRAAGIPILRLTSATSTEGFGITTQPMESQVAPVEAQEITQVLKATSVAILYDPSTYTAGISKQLAGLLGKQGVKIALERDVPPTATAATTNAALTAAAAARPSVTYLAMYGPQAGAAVASMSTLSASGVPGSFGQCFVDLAAQGAEFIKAGGAATTKCLASGVPAPSQLPGGAAYASAYTAAFNAIPGTWGAFTYDSLQVLASAVTHAGTWASGRVRQQLDATRNFTGVTGPITITTPSGNRVNPPVVILNVAPGGVYGVDASWAKVAGYAGPTTATTTTTVPATTTTTVPATTTTIAPTTTTTIAPTTTTVSVSTTTSKKTITFGAIFSTTGLASPYGASQVDGANLAIAQINASGGIKGDQVKLQISDDASTPATAATEMTAFAANQGIFAVLGPTLSNSAVVADPLADTAGLPVLAVSNTASGIVGTCPYPCTWIFRNSLGEATALPANIDVYVAKSHPKTGVVIAPQDDAYGAQTAQVAVSALTAAKVTVGAPVVVPPDEPALGAAVKAALASKPGVLTVTASSSAVAANVITDAREAGFTGGILGSNSFNAPATAKAAGTAGKGAQSGAAWYLGNPDPVNTKFIASYKARYGVAPDQFAAQSFTGVMLLAAAAASAPLGFTNIAADRSALKVALARVAIDTPLGPFKFTADQDVDQPVWVVAMNGKGGYTLVKKVPTSTAEAEARQAAPKP
jgi:branched-chain amino acid transport system substrate-binding protein